MSLKKKSVLGLSYLTVALLGASVLMVNPVSADEENEHTVHTQTKDMPAWERGKEDGWEKGWIDGNKPESTSPYDSEIEVPKPDSTPYDAPGMENDKVEYLQEYNDLYPAGYTAGYKAKMEKEEMSSNSDSESSEESSDGYTEQKELAVEAINQPDLSTGGAVITTGNGNGFGIMSTIFSIIKWFRSLF
ncbi:hypothetical protein [Streptococcus dysgalactiae]|uniref:Uncharacterized protein n=1 Tax=Streptococcus dysgalactiae subsp. equisimilis TaxID=119602 RepID=A0A9X8SXJ5_STREQ|nr:hypothetical protein [Streptococcus dysgalactiae]SQF66002.1 Uncharacterised protein [Streptococcus dysgalactiae subsp. equisimilis]VEF04701.1 Uncharacterised protein [Streptococcus dysgalactiae subsp. equisimilis]